MNSTIKKQLQNCRVANIPAFDNNTTEILIKKGNEFAVSPYQVGRCYLIELADYIINPPPDFTLADNWNQGRTPKYKHYKCEIKAVAGKMVRFMGSGYDIVTDTDANYVWDGWAPQKGIKIIEELK